MTGLTRFFTLIFKPFTSCFSPSPEPAELVPPLSQRISSPRKLRSNEHPITFPPHSAGRPALSKQFSSATTPSTRPSVVDVKVSPHGSYDDFSTRGVRSVMNLKKPGRTGSLGVEQDGASSHTRSSQRTLWSYPVQERKSSNRPHPNYLLPLPPPVVSTRRPLPHNSTLRLDMDVKPFRDLHINTVVAQAAPVYTDELMSSPSEMSLSEYPRYDEDGRQIPRSPAEISSLSLKEEIASNEIQSFAVSAYSEKDDQDRYAVMMMMNSSGPVTILPHGHARHLDDLQ